MLYAATANKVLAGQGFLSWITHKNWPKQTQVVACCNKTCKVCRSRSVLDAPFSLQAKIKSLFYIYYLCSSKSRRAEVILIRLASSLRSISQSYIFSLYKSYKDYLWELTPKYTRLSTVQYALKFKTHFLDNVLQLIQKSKTTRLFCVCGVFGSFCLFVFGVPFVYLFKKSVSKRLTLQILTWMRFRFPTEQLPCLFRADM